MITGRRVGAEEALQLGFVNAVIPHDKLMEIALAKAEEITQVSFLRQGDQTRVKRYGKARTAS